MSTKMVKMPTVHIPVLRQTVPTAGSFLTQPNEMLWGDSNTVMIEELVQGVQQCQMAAKKAADGIRRQKTDEPRRPRSPLPITERKPWGARDTTPKGTRSASATLPPATAAKTVLSRQPSDTAGREVRPASASGSPQELHAKPQLRSPQASGKVPAALRPKIEHHTPPTARATARQTSSPPPASPRMSSPAPPIVEARLAALEAKAKSLEEQVNSANERARLAEMRADSLEERIEMMRRDHEATEIASRERVLQLSAQLQYTMEWLHRFDALVMEGEGNQVAPNGAHSLSSSTQSQPLRHAVHVATDDSVARKLDMSSDSVRSHTRVPPNPPMELRF